MNRKIYLLRYMLNIMIAVLVFYSWLHMVFRGGGTLSSRGISSLKYYTVLSNLFSGLTALLFLSGRFRPFVPFLKLTSAVSITLTFLTVLFFLGPVFGYGTMYYGDNLWFHMVIPLLCILEYLTGERWHPEIRVRLRTLIPTILYGIGYTLHIFSGAPGADWYGFFRGGMVSGILIYIVLCLAIYITGVILTKTADFLHRS